MRLTARSSIRGRAQPQAGRYSAGSGNLVGRGIRNHSVGQDTTAYGSDLKNRPTLSGLLSDLSAIPGLRWLRLLYAHPAHITPDVLEAMAGQNICRDLDLLVQYIDDAILHASELPFHRR